MKHKKNIFLIALVIIFITVYFLVGYIGKKMGNLLIEYAQDEVTRIARYIVNYAVNTNNIDELNFNELFVTTKNQDDEIQTIDFDPVMVNKTLTKIVNNILNTITQTIIKYFKAVEEGNIDVINLQDSYLINTSIDKLKEGIIIEIPMGAVTKNTLLANLGPRIPVKLALLGDVASYIDTEVKYYGINNALITVYVNIDVNEQVYMPIASGRIKVNQKIPIAIKLMQGVVPNAYFGNLESSIFQEVFK